jgi:hypothetical protein
MSATTISKIIAASGETSRSFHDSLPSRSDMELIELAYELVPTEPPRETDWLYGVLGEIFERWAPEAMWLELTKSVRDGGVSDLAFEMGGHREGMVKRANARIAARCPIEGEAVAS